MKYRPTLTCEDKPYRQMVKLNSAILYVERHCIINVSQESLMRMLRALPDDLSDKIQSGDAPCTSINVQSVMREHADSKHKESIKIWRDKASCWKGSTTEACAFVRNPMPCKVTVLKDGEEATSQPARIQEILMRYWGTTHSSSLASALDNLEDHYRMYLPRYEYDAQLTTDLRSAVAKETKPSAAGLDAWTVPERRALPI